MATQLGFTYWKAVPFARQVLWPGRKLLFLNYFGIKGIAEPDSDIALICAYNEGSDATKWIQVASPETGN